MFKQFVSVFMALAGIVLFLPACRSSPEVLQTSSFSASAQTPTTLPLSTTTLTIAATRTPRPTAYPSPTAGPSPTPAALREPLWTFATQGEVWSSPTVRAGIVYFGSDDHFLYAVDIATHQLKWKFETGDIVRSRPAVNDGIVYFTSDDNNLYAVDAQSGQLVWKFDMGKRLVPRQPIPIEWDYMQSSPAVADGIVYVGSSNPNFYAVDARTGQEKWRFKAGFYVRSSPAVVDGSVYFGDWSNLFYSLDARTGQEKWRFDTGGSVVPSPTIVDGVIYIGSKFPCLFALDAQTGQKKWCFPYPDSAAWVESSAAVADGTVYVGSSDWDRVNAIEAATGQLKWYFQTKGVPWCSPAVSERMVYIGATGGFFYALDAVTGAEQWRVQTEKNLETNDGRFNGGVVSSPTIVDEVVYFGGLDGKLYAVSVTP